MRRYRFYQIDVFTNRRLAGNALAVFPDAAGLDAADMQALAREMNLSETTFVFASDRATRHVRFFTPTAEIPLAGHPTIGTWWTLAERGNVDLPRDGVTQVTQETGAGVLPVSIRTAGGQPTNVIMVQAVPQFGPTVADVGTLGTMLGGGPDLVAGEPPPQVVSTALPQLMVPARSLEALAALPSGGRGSDLATFLRTLGTDCAMCFTRETRAPDAKVHCRMFAPGLGVPEDPATGSAAGALGAYMVRHRLVTATDRTASIVVEQGLEIGRPSRIDVEVDVAPGGDIAEVRVGGQAITVIEGEVTL
ncbi:MAG: PhzF family phenazine biosynthesis protein [Gemmatimonadota bacterium]|nr:PhzF family phenazine biosynthesis protein [Gemmatimonadota bacterium]MDH3478525.1 PhzF family phenazine biosynthesis protein [Gemmatimonadota bacterium]MDH3570710.1 PhzF family phenazine biosynthesis protein [Gemmatimonadota bacterium]MDH5548428.1 PhzF family phenazine biosynthesis protein [Gemmatimonadota bacterium]